MKHTDQMELGLSNSQRLANSLEHRRRRANRARWWFAQMRRVVDHARVWQPAPPARPEQTWFEHVRLSGRTGVQSDCGGHPQGRTPAWPAKA